MIFNAMMFSKILIVACLMLFPVLVVIAQPAVSTRKMMKGKDSKGMKKEDECMDDRDNGTSFVCACNCPDGELECFFY